MGYSLVFTGRWHQAEMDDYRAVNSPRHSREIKNPWERGRPARTAALARVTLTLALSHKGRGDLSLAIHT